jgi:hypothetical protein
MPVNFEFVTNHIGAWRRCESRKALPSAERCGDGRAILIKADDVFA